MRGSSRVADERIKGRLDLNLQGDEKVNKVCVIGVYFGAFPNYFPLWLKSCENNPTVDFLLYTDQDLTDLPSNVFNHKITLREMKTKAEQALGFEVSLDKPYKCCDFKIVYGLIFKEDVCKYDYWGHCDFDLVFGDLQEFFDEYQLMQYDKFLPLGHLSLFRNTEEVNQRYMCKGSSKDYQTVFTSPDFYAFGSTLF